MPKQGYLGPKWADVSCLFVVMIDIRILFRQAYELNTPRPSLLRCREDEKVDHVVDMHTFQTHPISWTNQEVTGVCNLNVAHGMLVAIHINPDKASHSPLLPAGSAG